MKLNFIKNFLHKFKTEKKGFSLNDMVVVISTVAIVSVSSVAINSVDNKNRRKINDNQKIERIYTAMERFVRDNKRLPCPAGLIKVKGTSADYAQEIGSGDTCVGNSTHGVYTISADSNLIYGAIPVKTLGLTLDTAEDAFGSKFIYIIDRRLAYNISSNNAQGHFGTLTSSSIKILENDIEISPDSVFVIMSYGKNKAGAFNANSSTFNTLPSSTSVSETNNSFTSISGTTINMTNTTFVKAVKGDVNFDDLLFFKDKKTLINDFKADILLSCINAGDKYGNKNAQFGETVFATANCPQPNQTIRAAKKCGKNGKWIFERSCPCYVEIDGIEPNSVPNGIGNLKCTKASYSGVLKFTCDDDGNLTINEYCKKSCNFSAIGINQTIPDGVSIASCNQQNFKGEYVITCSDGTVTSQVGNCKSSTCQVGGYSGMIAQTVNSGSSSTQGLCDIVDGYSGFYSYSCEDGIGVVTDKCFKNCSFSTVGISATNLRHGISSINCPSNSISKSIQIECNDGLASIKSGSCQVQGKCLVGSGVGMVAKSVNLNTSGSDGQCDSGYTGSYSYTCSAAGIQSTTNNCLPSNCVVGKDIPGLIFKTVSLNSSGSDGKCASGYGGYFSWSCDAKGVPTVTANNCVNFCKVGTADMGDGMIEEVVGFGKSGETGLCDISRGYTGNYSWSCVENSDTKIVESKVLVNNCKNFCTVGTSDDGNGMIQKQVKINSTGTNGTCAAGYVGSYKWSCDASGNSKVTENNCINSCQVGILTQGKGMIAKNVNLNTSGSDGVCDESAGYTGSYSWSCSSNGVAQITANNCLCSVDGLCQSSCRVGTLAQGLGMIEKRVAFNTSGTDGLCNTAEGYAGSYSWSCSTTGLARVTRNNCAKANCLVDVSSYSGLQPFFGLANSKGTNGLCADGYVGSYSWQCNSLGIGSVVANNCQAIKCKIPEGVIGFNPNSIDVAYGEYTYNCNSEDYTGTAILKCSKNGILSNGIFSEKSNSCVSACSVGSIGSSIVNDGQTMNITISSTDSIVSSKDSIIKNIIFASYGIPNTTTNPWLISGCHATNSLSKVAAACLNKNTCSITANSSTFQTLTCSDTSTKKLAVKYVYSLPQFKNTLKVPIGSGTFSCSNGYVGTINYSCGGTHESFSYTGSCLPACEIPAATGYDSVTLLGSGSFSCKTGYFGTISYNCSAPNIFTLSGACEMIMCDVPNNNTMLAGQKVNFSSSFVPLLCSAGYYGSPTYKCSGTSVVGTYTSGGSECQPISCDVPNVYNLGLSSVNYAPIASNIDCDQGYTNNGVQPKYRCVNDANNPKGTFSLTAGSCSKIICNVSSNLNLALPSSPNEAITSVDYTSSSALLICKTGYAYGATQPSYTCNGTLNPGTFTKNAATCSPITCSLPSGTVGFITGTSGIEFGNGTYYCNAPNYSTLSTASFNCAANGNSVNGTLTQISNTCECNVGYVKDASNNCIPSCSIPAGTGYAATTVSGSGTLNCLSGFAGEVSYNCSAPNTPNINNTCTAITCNVPSGIAGFITGTSGITLGDGTYFCNAANYSTLSTASFNCAANGNNSIGIFSQVSNSCECSTGYVKDASNNCIPSCSIPAGTGYAATTVTGSGTLNCLSGFVGNVSYNCSAPNTPNLNSTCTAITCSVPSGIAGFITGTSGITFGTKNYNCNATNYSTTSTASFSCTANGNSSTGIFSQVSNSCACSTGYVKDASNNCIPSCSIPAGTGYSAITVNKSGTINCLSGFLGSVTYNCTAPNTPNLSGACTPITCAIDANTGYTARTLSFGTGSFACNVAGFTGTISYNCSDTNKSSLNGTCTPITCSAPASSGYSAQSNLPYTATIGSGIIPCSQTGYTGTANYTCQAMGTAIITKTCSCSSGYGIKETGNFLKIVNPDFLSRYGGRTSGSSFSLNGWSLVANGGTYGNEGMAPLLFNVNAGISCRDGTGYPYSAGYFTYTPIITISMPSPGAIIKKFDWHGVSNIHGSWRNAKNVIFEVLNGSTWVSLLNFTLPSSSSCGGPNSYTFQNTIRSTSYRFRVLNTYGDTAKIRGFIFYEPETICTAITCDIPSQTGYNARILNFGSGKFDCDVPGYFGTISYNCNAINTPNLSGTCAVF